jgi:hypothetical protein
MYTINFNPVFILVASFLVFVSGEKIYILSPNFSSHSIYLLWNLLILSVSITGIVFFISRNHISLNEKYLSIRNTVFKGKISFALSDIQEIVYGKQDWGTWTKGRKVLTVKKVNGDSVHFFSAAWLSKNKRVELFEKLKKLGINARIKQ